MGYTYPDPNKKKIFITGANRSFGPEVVQQLVEQNPVYRSYALARRIRCQEQILITFH